MEFFNLLKYGFSFFGALVASHLLTKYVIVRCNQTQLMDIPNDRKLHVNPVPRLGGIAVFTSFQVVVLSLCLMYGHLFRDANLGFSWWIISLIPMAMIVAVGVVDDLFELSPFVKLLGQIAASSILIYSGTSIGNVSFFELHPVVDYFATLFWFLLVINALNLIDGLDGLAGGIAAIAATGLFGIFLISNDVFSSLVMLAFIGAIAGFLIHNFHPAKIFLGDCGSMFLGLALAAFTLHSPSKGSTVATLGACILALGIPLLDTALAVWRRSLRRFFGSGDGLMSADMDHLHHRLVRRGFNQQKVALTLYALSAFLVATGLLSLLFSSYSHGIYLIAFTFGTYILVRHLAHVELWDSGTAIARGISRPSSSMVTTFLYPVADVLVMAVSLFVTLQLVGSYSAWADFRNDFLALSSVWIGIPFVCIGLAATYQRVWSRARISEFVYLVGAFLTGIFVCLALSEFFLFQSTVPDMVLFSTLYFGLGGGMLTALRAIPRVVADLMVLNSDAKRVEPGERRRILIVGAQVLYLRFLKDVNWEDVNAVPFTVVGIVDDDRNLRKRIVHGYKVLGTTAEVPRILSRFEIDEIVITGGLHEISRMELSKLCDNLSIVLKEWKVSESVVSTKSLGLTPELVRVVSNGGQSDSESAFTAPLNLSIDSRPQTKV